MIKYEEQFAAARERERRAAEVAQEARQEARLDRVAERVNLQAFVEGRIKATDQRNLTVLGTDRVTVTQTARALYFELNRVTNTEIGNAELAKRLAVPESAVIGALAELDYYGFVSVQRDKRGTRLLRALAPSLV